MMLDPKDPKAFRRSPDETEHTGRVRARVRFVPWFLVGALALSAAACSSSSKPAAPKASRSAAAARTSSPETVLASANGQYGSILVDSQGMTLYRFTKDSAGTSACNGTCATTWPPLTVASGTTPTSGAGVTGTLGTITRQDGSEQVTFNGSPLYTFSGDSAAGQTNGQGIENLWFVVSADGTGSPGSPASPGSTATAPSNTASTPTTTSSPTDSSSGADATPVQPPSSPATQSPTPTPTAAPTTAPTTTPTTSPPTTAPPSTTQTTTPGGYGY